MLQRRKQTTIVTEKEADDDCNRKGSRWHVAGLGHTTNRILKEIYASDWMSKNRQPALKVRRSSGCCRVKPRGRTCKIYYYMYSHMRKEEEIGNADSRV